MELIRCENLVKNYGKTPVLKRVSLKIQKGEFIGIMGKSGSGKTTLLKILGMMEPLSDGKVFYKRKNMESISVKEAAGIRREELGFIFQEFFLMDSLNVLENIMLPLFISKKADEKQKEKARELMEKFEIGNLEHKMPDELSGGERQRVAICRALINDPQIIFADEPTGNLDSKSGAKVVGALQMIHQEFGKTVIMVTHDPKMASFCGRVLLLKDGMILEQLEHGKDGADFYRVIVEKMTEL